MKWFDTLTSRLQNLFHKEKKITKIPDNSDHSEKQQLLKETKELPSSDDLRFQVVQSVHEANRSKSKTEIIDIDETDDSAHTEIQYFPALKSELSIFLKTDLLRTECFFDLLIDPYSEDTETNQISIIYLTSKNLVLKRENIKSEIDLTLDNSDLISVLWSVLRKSRTKFLPDRNNAFYRFPPVTAGSDNKNITVLSSESGSLGVPLNDGFFPSASSNQNSVSEETFFRIISLRRKIRQFSQRRLPCRIRNRNCLIVIQKYLPVHDIYTVDYSEKENCTESIDQIRDRLYPIADSDTLFRIILIKRRRNLRQQNGHLLPCHENRKYSCKYSLSASPAVIFRLWIQPITVRNILDSSNRESVNPISNKIQLETVIYEEIILNDFMLNHLFGIFLPSSTVLKDNSLIFRNWKSYSVAVRSQSYAVQLSKADLLKTFFPENQRFFVDRLMLKEVFQNLETVKITAGRKEYKTDPFTIEVLIPEKNEWTLRETCLVIDDQISWALLYAVLWFSKLFSLPVIQNSERLKQPVFQTDWKFFTANPRLFCKLFLFFFILGKNTVTDLREAKKSWNSLNYENRKYLLHPVCSSLTYFDQDMIFFTAASEDPLAELSQYEIKPVLFAELKNAPVPCLSEGEIQTYPDPFEYFSLTVGQAVEYSENQNPVSDQESTVMGWSNLQSVQTVNLLFQALRNYKRMDLSSELEKDISRELINRLKYGPLLGFDLLVYLTNPKFERQLHEKADWALMEVCSGNFARYRNYSLIAVSLSCMAARHYSDNQFYKHTADLYRITYSRYKPGKVQSVIRNIAYFFSGENDSSYFIRQALFPQKYLGNALKLAGTLYQDMLHCCLNPHPEAIMIDFFRNYRQLLHKRRPDSEATTVSLIESVQWALDDERHYPELIDYLTMVLKMMDAYYWQKSLDGFEYSDYFAHAFENYHFERRIYHSGPRSGREQHRQIQSTQFHLSRDRVRIRTETLVIPDYREMNQLALTLWNGNRKVFQKEDLSIYINDDDEYFVDSELINVDHPVGLLRCEITDQNDHTVLYDSEEELYRPYILFDSNGNEVRGKIIENEIYTVVGKPDADAENMVLIDRKPDYSLWQFSVSSDNEFGTIDGNVLSSGKKDLIQVHGIQNSKIQISDGRTSYPVYSRIDTAQISISDRQNDDLYVLMDDDQHSILDKTISSFKDTPAGSEYIISLKDIQRPGYHSLRIWSRTENQELLRSEFFIAEVPDLITEPNKDRFSVVLFNNLVGEAEEDEGESLCWSGYLNTEEEEILPIRLSDSHFSQPLRIHVELDKIFYRVVTTDFFMEELPDEWRAEEVPILINEINVDSRIYFEGPAFDRIEACNGKHIYESIQVKTDPFGRKWITAEQLTNISSDDSKILLILKDGNRPVGLIDFLKKTILEKDSFTYSLDRSKNLGRLEFQLTGPDPVTVHLKSDDLKMKDAEISEDLFIHNLCIEFPAEPEINYYFELTGGSDDDLFSDYSEPYSIYRQTIWFPPYDIKDWTSYWAKTLIVAGGERRNLSGKDCKILVGDEIKPYVRKALLITAEPSSRGKESVKEVEAEMNSRSLRTVEKINLTSNDGDIVVDLRTGNITVADLSKDKDWGNHFTHFSNLEISRKR